MAELDRSALGPESARRQPFSMNEIGFPRHNARVECTIALLSNDLRNKYLDQREFHNN